MAMLNQAVKLPTVLVRYLPKLSFRTMVNMEFRYGMWLLPPPRSAGGDEITPECNQLSLLEFGESKVLALLEWEGLCLWAWLVWLVWTWGLEFCRLSCCKVTITCSK